MRCEEIYQVLQFTVPTPVYMFIWGQVDSPRYSRNTQVQYSINANKRNEDPEIFRNLASDVGENEIITMWRGERGLHADSCC